MIRTIVTDAPFSPENESERLAAARGADCGALATFVGYCRGCNGDDAVTQLELQHYPGFTEAEIERLAQQVAGKYGLGALVVIHRVGLIAPGEAIVFVAAQSSHRAAAFAAVAETMDYLKTDAPIWKREIGAAGARWIEPTATDYARRREHGQ